MKLATYHNTFPKIWVSAIFIFSLSLFYIFPSTANAQNDNDGEIVIYMDSTAQIIRGFGAANIVGWRPDMTSEDVEKAFGNEEGQLGLSILRIRIPPQQNQWSSNLSTAQKAHEIGAKVIASPWSPPADMKSNGSTTGGRLKDESYQDYADHLQDFADYMEENGVPLYGISIQNEPDIQVGYESCDWTPDEMVKFLKENAGSIDVPIIAPESFQFRRQMSDPILNDSLAAANLDILGGHIYGGGNSRYLLAEQKGKEIWMTEYLMNLNTGNSGADPWSSYSEEEIWEETMSMASSIQQSMRNNWNAYIWWYLKRYYSFIGDGEQDTPLGEILKRGYAFSQFSRFVQPGYTRVHTEVPLARGQLNISTTAYKDSTQIVIVAINGESTDKEFTFKVENGTPLKVSQYRTSISQNVQKMEDVEVVGSGFTAVLPPQTITTFVADGYLPVSNTEKISRPKAIKLHQNYPNPFNPSTVIRYQLPVSSVVSLKVFDMLGREVAILVNGQVRAGEHQVHFNASELSSGVYFYTIEADNFSQTKKMLLIK